MYEHPLWGSKDAAGDSTIQLKGYIVPLYYVSFMTVRPSLSELFQITRRGLRTWAIAPFNLKGGLYSL